MFCFHSPTILALELFRKHYNCIYLHYGASISSLICCQTRLNHFNSNFPKQVIFQQTPRLEIFQLKGESCRKDTNYWKHGFTMETIKQSLTDTSYWGSHNTWIAAQDIMQFYTVASCPSVTRVNQGRGPSPLSSVQWREDNGRQASHR